jgi:Xaa-Pro aminopeptidase
MDLRTFDPAPHAARRKRLAERIGALPAVVPAGRSVSRNYRANTYPYRASSHFLYFVGLPLEGAVALMEGDRCTLFLPLPEVDDDLWHGPVPSFRALAEATGCAVAPLDQLGDAILAEETATVAGPDVATRTAQSALLGREIGGALVELDARLADAIIDLRLRHDAAAIASLRRAAQGTREAHLAGMRATKPGVREAHVRGAMEGALLSLGMGTSYQPIVTTHGEVLHSNYYGHTIEAGDLVLADVGAETEDGWAGDVTRTWPASGKFSPAQRALYDVVLRAQAAAIAAVAPGTRYRDVHLAASREIAHGLVELGILRGDPDELVADGVHAMFFPHGVGHLLGLDVHDMEDLGDRAGYAPGRERSSQFGLSYLRLDRDLEPGMVVTIEPGYYRVPALLRSEKLMAVAHDRIDLARLAEFEDVRGIRIEDDVLVTDHGAEVLTNAIPKEPSEVEAAVGRSS